MGGGSQQYLFCCCVAVDLICDQKFNRLKLDIDKIKNQIDKIDKLIRFKNQKYFE